MQSARLLEVAVAASLAGGLLVNYLVAVPSHQTAYAAQQQHLPDETQNRLPSADVLRGVSLNFETLAADVAWIWSLVYYGKHLSGTARPAYLEHSAETIADLDPRFYEVYPWFSAIYIRTQHPPSHEELDTVNNFLERGMEIFPTDYRLPREAGLNYIGYSEDRTDEQRIEELTRGIEYLQRASKMEGAPADLPLTVSWMYQRRRQLRSGKDGPPSSEQRREVGPEQVEFLTEMYYLVDDAGVRRAIEYKLSNSPRGQKMLARYDRRYDQRLRRQHSESFSYLPLSIWAAVADLNR